MKFEPLDIVALDIIAACGATNAEREVTIISNVKGFFELWIAGDFINQFSVFDDAVRNAECMVSFTMEN